MKDRNVVVLGVSHSGTTIVTAIINTLGWKFKEDDKDYRDRWMHKRVVELNADMMPTIKNGKPINQESYNKSIGKFLENTPTPFVLHDDRFVRTLKYWVGPLKPYRPVLIYIKRDKDRLVESFKRRGQRCEKGPWGRYGFSVEGLIEKANKRYDEWPWEKIAIDYNTLGSAIKLWDHERESTKSSKFGKAGI